MRCRYRSNEHSRSASDVRRLRGDLCEQFEQCSGPEGNPPAKFWLAYACNASISRRRCKAGLWGSGYPHTGGLWPESSKYIGEHTLGVAAWRVAAKPSMRSPQLASSSCPHIPVLQPVAGW